MNIKTFWNLSYGIYVISAWDEGRPTGCIANCAMQITAEPATIAVSINHDNFTNSCIADTKRFAISILGESTEPSVIGTFGFRSGKDINKFEKVPFEICDDMPVLSRSCGYLTCTVINVMETDTHTVFLGKVDDADILFEDKPMTYEYYYKVIKGRSAKNAPTYIAPEKKEAKLAEAVPTETKPTETYKCSVCGYVYDGKIPFTELPDNYVCPVCGQPKSVFIKE